MAILIERLAKLVFSEVSLMMCDGNIAADVVQYQYQVTETPVFGVMNGTVVMGSIVRAGFLVEKLFLTHALAGYNSEEA